MEAETGEYSPEVPEIIGKRYILLEKLGKGGMGVVFKAIDRLTRQPVALKRVSGSVMLSRSGAESFDRRLALAQEFQTLSSLRHPHIISVLDYGFDEQNQPYLTMDLLDRPQTILDIGWRTHSLLTKVNFLVQTLQALAYLHRRGILHRDLKPANILVLKGQIKLLDFGLSMAHEQNSGIVGTPAYIAPELLRGDPASTASDLYAIGVIAYELFVGKHPFKTSNIAELIADVLQFQPDLTPIALSPDDTVLMNADTVIDAELDYLPGSEQQLDGKDTAGLLDKESTAIDLDETVRLRLITDAASNLTVRQTVLAEGMLKSPNNMLGAVVQKLLAKSAHERYRDASAVIRDLSLAMGMPLPVETAATRESFLQAAHFVGRTGELSTLSTALSSVMDGRGSTWLIGGESGVGKTRLCDELRTRALVRGVVVLRGQAFGSGLPYQMWRDPLRYLALNAALNDADAAILKVIIPDIEELLDRRLPDVSEADPEQARSRLLSVITSLFQQQTQPILLILEDMQWAQAESIPILQQLNQAIEHLPIMVLCSYRDDEDSALVEQFPGAQRLTLGRLSEREIAELSQSMLGPVGLQPRLRNLLQRESEGNVFFIVEVVRALAEEAGSLDKIGSGALPEHVFTGGVKAIVQRRLKRITPADLPLLQSAAVMGRQLDLAVVQALAPRRNLDAWLVACAEAAVLEVKDQQWQFTHDKLREGILMELDRHSCSTLHHQVAEAIESTYPGAAEYAATLTYHWREAGNAANESYYAAIAGEQASKISANQEAIMYFERSLTLLEGLDDLAGAQERRGLLLAELGKAHLRLSAYPEASRLLRQSLTLATEIGSMHLQAEALCGLGYAMLFQGDRKQADQCFQESLWLYRQVHDQRGMADALRGLARIAAMRGSHVEAARRLEESLSLSRQANDISRTAKALGELGKIAGIQGAYEEANERLAESLELNRKLGNREGTASALLDLGQVALFQGELTLAGQYLSHSLSIYREIGDRRAATDALNNLGYTAFLRKDYIEARERFEECLIIFQSVGFLWGQVNTLTNLGHVAMELGDAPQATQYFHEALEQAVTLKAIPLILEIIAGMARLLTYAGQEVLALEWLGFVLDHPASSSDIKSIAEPLMAELQNAVDANEFEVALNRGRQRDLDGMTAELLTTTFDAPIEMIAPDTYEEFHLFSLPDLHSADRTEEADSRYAFK